MKKEDLLYKPIIFIGTGRSGTSIISEIIMRHSELAFPSQYQNKFPKTNSINYIRRLFDNKLWRIHGQKKQLNKVNFLNRYTFNAVEAFKMWNAITEDGINFSRDFLIDTSASESDKSNIRKYFIKMIRGQGKTRLSFKITGPSKIEYLSSIFPDAFFIRIIREPIPMISSFLKSPFWQSRGESRLWWTGPYSSGEKKWIRDVGNPVAITAFQIKKILDITDIECEKIDPNIKTIKYADFVSNPKNIVKEILEFTELPHDKYCFDYFKSNKVYNRNKKDEEYFSKEDLQIIHDIFQKNESHFLEI